MVKTTLPETEQDNAGAILAQAVFYVPHFESTGAGNVGRNRNHEFYYQRGPLQPKELFDYCYTVLAQRGAVIKLTVVWPDHGQCYYRSALG